MFPLTKLVRTVGGNYKQCYEMTSRPNSRLLSKIHISDSLQFLTVFKRNFENLFCGQSNLVAKINKFICTILANS